MRQLGADHSALELCFEGCPRAAKLVVLFGLLLFLATFLPLIKCYLDSDGLMVLVHFPPRLAFLHRVLAAVPEPPVILELVMIWFNNRLIGKIILLNVLLLLFLFFFGCLVLMG